MTMTEADMSHATAWPSWFQAACPFFLALPLAERRPAPEGPPRPSRSAALTPMPLAPGVPQERHRGASGSACASAGIALQDWDLLFRAVLETLGRTAGDSIPPDAVDRGVQSPGDVLAECLQALEHLRRSVPLCDAAGCAEAGAHGQCLK